MRVLLILACLVAAPAAASVQAGAEKWRAGDWEGALAEWATPAARGDADALFNMGQAYRLGRGVPQNRLTAIDYYRRAADKGHVASMANLGITLWQEGRKTEALGALRQAADRGDLRASYVLGVATFGGDGAPKNPALGYGYVVRARDGGLALASAQAARMATLLSPEDRARGEAAAAALAAGRPVAVAFAADNTTRPATPQTATPALPDDAEPDSEAPPPSSTPAPAEVRAAAAPAAERPPAGAGKAPEGPAAEAPTAWKVQLGAYTSERAARTAWANLISQSAPLLKGLKPDYSPRGALVRLQVGPFKEREDAGALCAQLSAAGRPCFVTRG